MHYKKIDEYRFTTPKEYKACLAFKERLSDMGTKYYEENHGMYVSIRIYTYGDFEVDDKCDILQIVKEEE